jgi:phosphoribosylaminoimidazole-succinocarboxamide synthase
VSELSHLYRGKVRDLYEVSDELMLMVASDRLSAFDVVMNEEIPNKGRVLTALTDYWLERAGLEVPQRSSPLTQRSLRRTPRPSPSTPSGTGA